MVEEGNGGETSAEAGRNYRGERGKWRPTGDGQSFGSVSGGKGAKEFLDYG